MVQNFTDTTPPELTSFDLPTLVDLSNGPANMTFGATATDDLSGVDQVVAYFGKSFSWSFRADSSNFNNYSFLPFYGIYDDWSDGVARETMSISQFNAPGIYTVDRVVIRDTLNNERSYSAAQLETLGFDTQMEFSGPAPGAGQPVARGPSEVLTFTEGESGNISIEFANLTNSSFSYRYYLTTEGGTASAGDYSGGAGAGSMSIMATSPQSRTIDIPFSALVDSQVEGPESLFLVVELNGLTFANGRPVQESALSILDNQPTQGAVSVIGEPGQGETLQADLSGLSDPDGLNPAGHSYQWLRGDVEITGATGATYDITRADAGADISVRAGFHDVFGATGSMTSAAVAVDPALPGQISITGADADDVTVTVLAGDNSDILTPDADGNIAFSTAERGTITVTATKPATDIAQLITAQDALIALRLAVGLADQADAFSFIAADINRDGQVTAYDALEILRYAVGLETDATPGWVLFDAASDFSQITKDQISFDEGGVIEDCASQPALTLQAVLVGDVDGSLWSGIA